MDTGEGRSAFSRRLHGRIVVTGATTWRPSCVRRAVRIVLGCWLPLLVAAGSTAPLDPDPAYGRGAGQVNFSLGARDATLGPSVLQKDGKLLVTAYGELVSASASLPGGAFIRRYHGDGSPDESFGDAGTVQLAMAQGAAYEQVTLQPDGKILLQVNGWWPCTATDISCWVGSGADDYADYHGGEGLVRLLDDGTLDPSFGGAGFVVPDPEMMLGPSEALTLQSDGRILTLWSSSDNRARRSSWHVARFNVDGTTDPGFNNGRPVESRCQSLGHALVVQPDDGFVVAGNADFFGGYDGICLERRMRDGSPDLTFNDGILWTAVRTRTDVTVDTIEVLADGKLLVAGSGLDYSGATMQSGVVAARYSADGMPDTTYGSGGAVFLPVTADPRAYVHTGIVLARDGGFVATGYEYEYQSGNASQFTRVFLKVGPRGDPDPAFGENGIARQSPGGDVPRAFVRDIEDRWLLVSSTASGPALAKGTIARYLGERPDAVPAIEFYNGPLRHYFLTASTTEAAGIDAGAAGPGWWRTGAVIPAFLPLAADTLAGLPQAARPLCRFYGTPGAGPNSHFYTISEAECAKVRQDPGWSFEHYAFAAYPGIVIDGEAGCAEGLQPVWRLYNNRFAQNDSNHRYTTSESTRRQMKNIGWIDEGIVFCAAAE